MIRYRAHEVREQRIVREVEAFADSFRLVSSKEERHHGRFLLAGGWSWAEVVTLANGVYVGGDIDTVVFQGYRSKDSGARAPIYWMATRSYGYASEKAHAGDVQHVEWDREIAAEAVLWMRRDKSIGKDTARDLLDVLRSDCDQSAFIEAMHEAGVECDDLSAGEVVARRVYLATAVLRKLVYLLETRDFRTSAREWFLGSEAA